MITNVDASKSLLEVCSTLFPLDYELSNMFGCNHLFLTGMVSVCAGCNDFKPWAALLVGFMAGCAYIVWHYAVLRLKIDDPLDAVAGEECIYNKLRGQGR